MYRNPSRKNKLKKINNNNRNKLIGKLLSKSLRIKANNNYYNSNSLESYRAKTLSIIYMIILIAIITNNNKIIIILSRRMNNIIANKNDYFFFLFIIKILILF